MGTSEIAVLVAAAAMIVSLVFNVISTRRGTREDTQRSASNTAAVIIKLENISSDIKEIKTDVRGVKDDVKELRERVVVVEQSTKQAHKRLDEHLHTDRV